MATCVRRTSESGTEHNNQRQCSAQRSYEKRVASTPCTHEQSAAACHAVSLVITSFDGEYQIAVTSSIHRASTANSLPEESMVDVGPVDDWIENMYY